MLGIPFPVSDTEYSLMIILEEDNVERIIAYDPAEVCVNKFGAPWDRMKLKDIVITFGTTEEIREAVRLCAAGKTIEAMRILTRGYPFKPGGAPAWKM